MIQGTVSKALQLADRHRRADLDHSMSVNLVFGECVHETQPSGRTLPVLIDHGGLARVMRVLLMTLSSV